jgi:hypothetical protein
MNARGQLHYETCRGPQVIESRWPCRALSAARSGRVSLRFTKLRNGVVGSTSKAPKETAPQRHVEALGAMSTKDLRSVRSCDGIAVSGRTRGEDARA